MSRFFPSLPLLALLVTAGSAQAQISRDFVETLPADTTHLTLNVARGRVLILHAGEQGPAGVDVRLSWFDPQAAKADGEPARAEAERRAQNRAERMFERLRPRVESHGQRFALAVRDPQPVVFDFDPTLQVTVDVTVRVPEGTRLELRGVDAGVTVERDYVGDLDLRTDNGSYFVQSVSGDFAATTGGGSITVVAVGGKADLFSRSGAIVAGRLHGPARLATASGSIEVLQALDRLKWTPLVGQWDRES